MYKADLNNLICIPTTDGQEKEKVPFFLFVFVFYKHPKLASTGIPTLVTMHAQLFKKTKQQHQSPIQYKADVSLEERENQKRSEQINKKREL